MITTRAFITRDAEFERCLEELKKAGGGSALIAAKAEEVIQKMNGPESLHPLAVRRTTKYGDHRIRGCLKYDLGNGFRMVCIREGQHLVFLYVGTHDDCCRWIKNNTGLQYDRGEEIREEAEADTVAPEPPPEYAVLDELRRWADEYEAELMSRIDEKTLRRVFAGLCGESP